MKKDDFVRTESEFLLEIRRIVENGRKSACSAISSVMIETYWHIGEKIVEQEQKGKERAD